MRALTLFALLELLLKPKVLAFPTATAVPLAAGAGTNESVIQQTGCRLFVWVCGAHVHLLLLHRIMAPLIYLEHIIDALQGFRRPLREGREAMKNIIIVGIRSKTAKAVHIEAACVRTTKINEPPVRINVSINPSKSASTEEKIQNISCTCPSGASKQHSCKHAMAVLLFLERFVLPAYNWLLCFYFNNSSHITNLY